MRYIVLLMGLVAALWSNAQQITQGEYFFNNDPGYGKATAFTFNAAQELSFTENISVSHLQDGVQTIFYRFKDDKGNWGQTNSSVFYKVVTPKIAKLYFQINDSEPSVVSIYPKVNKLDYTLNKNIAELEDGNCTINFWVENDLGTLSERWTESFTKTTTGIGFEYANVAVEAYPNPTSDKINIKTQSLIKQISVYTLAGALVLKDNSGATQINIETIPAGTYLFSIKTDRGISVKTIVKN